MEQEGIKQCEYSPTKGTNVCRPASSRPFRPRLLALLLFWSITLQPILLQTVSNFSSHEQNT
jgi:hypothetical protein